jgi:hypothetical protein
VNTFGAYICMNLSCLLIRSAVPAVLIESRSERCSSAPSPAMFGSPGPETWST